MEGYDFAVVGGGIVDLSTTQSLLDRCPGTGVLVLDPSAIPSSNALCGMHER